MPRKPFVLLVMVALAFAAFSGPAAWGAQELTVSAAASLTNAFQKLGTGFEKLNPDTKVIFNFAASGPLLQQIDKGAPVDVFASADQSTMDQAEKKGLIAPPTRKNFVSNRLVLIVPGDSKLAVTDLGDLNLRDIKRIAVGNPETVPAGRYARGALTQLGLWEVLTHKFIFGESVRQVLDYVSRGEVDAGFVYATDAAVAKGKVKIMREVAGLQPIIYPIAVIAASGKKELAQRFLDYVLSPEGQGILSEYGFGRP